MYFLVNGTHHIYCLAFLGNPCEMNDPCVHPKPECVPSDDYLRATCQCLPGYTGDQCDMKCKQSVVLQKTLEIVISDKIYYNVPYQLST